MKQVYLGNTGAYVLETAQRLPWKTIDGLSEVLSYQSKRKVRRDKVKSALAASSTLPRTHSDLMTVFMKVLEEHHEDCFFNQLLTESRARYFSIHSSLVCTHSILLVMASEEVNRTSSHAGGADVLWHWTGSNSTQIGA